MRNLFSALALIIVLAAIVSAQSITNGGTGPTLPPGPCIPGSIFTKVDGIVTLNLCAPDTTWAELVPAGGGLQSGMIVLSLSACGTGFSEATELNGVTLIGTLAVNGNVGTTGGSDTITQTLNHTHTANVNDPGHTHVQGVNSVATGGLSGYTADTSTNTRVNSGYSTSSGATGITVTTNNPAGGVASTDNRSAFIRVIFCRRN